jgi:hypothetical protein
MSLRQLARLIGVSDTAVRKAERAGVFGDAVRRDAAGEPGVVDVAGAIAAWERSGRQLRGSRAQDGSSQMPTPTHPAPAMPLVPIDPGTEDEPDDEPDVAVAPTSPTVVQAQRMVLEERHRRLKLENDEREGSLVRVEDSMRQAFEFARVLRENIMNVPGRIAAELETEGDAARLHARLENALRDALDATANVIEAALETDTTAA